MSLHVLFAPTLADAPGPLPQFRDEGRHPLVIATELLAGGVDAGLQLVHQPAAIQDMGPIIAVMYFPTNV